MKQLQLYAMILLMVMTFHIGRSGLPFVEYALFKKHIAEQLCVKKDIKGNCCQGKCFLEKQIKQATDTDTSANSHNENQLKKISKTEIIEFIRASAFHISLSPVFKLIGTRGYEIRIIHTILEVIDKPPQNTPTY